MPLDLSSWEETNEYLRGYRNSAYEQPQKFSSLQGPQSMLSDPLSNKMERARVMAQGLDAEGVHPQEIALRILIEQPDMPLALVISFLKLNGESELSTILSDVARFMRNLNDEKEEELRQDIFQSLASDKLFGNVISSVKNCT